MKTRMLDLKQFRWEIRWGYRLMNIWTTKYSERKITEKMTKKEILAEMNEIADELLVKVPQGFGEDFCYPRATNTTIRRAVKEFNQIHCNDELSAHYNRYDKYVAICVRYVPIRFY